MRAGRALIGLALQFNNGAYDPRALALVTLAALLAIAAALRLRFEPSTRGLVRTGHGAQRALGGQPGANGVFVDEPRFQYWSYAAVVGARILVVKPTAPTCAWISRSARTAATSTSPRSSEPGCIGPWTTLP